MAKPRENVLWSVIVLVFQTKCDCKRTVTSEGMALTKTAVCLVPEELVLPDGILLPLMFVSWIPSKRFARPKSRSGCPTRTTLLDERKKESKTALTVCSNHKDRNCESSLRFSLLEWTVGDS